jgi:hypothetical protein
LPAGTGFDALAGLPAKEAGLRRRTPGLIAVREAGVPAHPGHAAVAGVQGKNLPTRATVSGDILTVSFSSVALAGF